MKIAVIGTGNGGQAIAGHMAYLGHKVKLYGRQQSIVSAINSRGKIILVGNFQAEGVVSASTDLQYVVKDSEVIMIVTTATAHYDLACSLSPFLEDEQIVVLNPGRTCGAIEFKNALRDCGNTKRIYISETQTLVYACRLLEVGIVNIIGVKNRVLLASYPASETCYVIERLKPMYQCFVPAENVLRTSLENVGAIFHPCVVLFNAATIERGDVFYFYRDMTLRVATFIENFDKERLRVGDVYGIKLMRVRDWISYAYENIAGESLCEKMRNNPAYYDILAPVSIYSRQLLEDIPTGVLPILELGKVAGLEMKLFESMVDICGFLLGIDFRENGRTLCRLGLDNMSKEEILNYLS